MQNLAFLQPQFITDHTKLAEGVYQTTYEDGTKIIINYTPNDYAIETVIIPSMQFTVVKGN
jgi:hypothetical protein